MYFYMYVVDLLQNKNGGNIFKNNFHEQTGTEFFVTRFFISSVCYSSMGLEKRNTLSLFSLSLYLIKACNFFSV